MKKQTKNKLTALAMALCMLLSAPALAHSGRTDANGGHRDNKNVSGLGSYHYHCGGHPAHLHPNGVCPYDKKPSSSSSGTVSSRPAPTPKPAPKIVGTYFKTYINDAEIPTFSHSENGGAYVIAEDLANYGFDISWNGDTKTVTISKNNQKQITPMDMSYYNSIQPGDAVFTINASSGTKIVLEANGYTYSPAAYDCGGYMALSADELKMMGDWHWYSESNCITLNTR